MHRNRSRSSGWSALRFPNLPVARFSIGLALTLSICISSPLTPAEQGEHANRSCKPAPPYAVEMTAMGDTQWSLVLSNTAASQDLVVWMWAEIDAAGGTAARQQVWSGNLQESTLEQITVQYAAPANARRVWASLESPDQSLDLQAAARRGVAVANGPAARTAVRRKNHVVTEDPVSGRRVEQYVGQGGVQ